MVGGFIQTLFGKISNIMIWLKDRHADELKNQGHRLTGKLINTLEAKTILTPRKIVGQLWMEDYGRFMQSGIKANRIPYSGRSGRKFSKYIQGLIGFFKLKGLGAKESKRAAFATANKHKKEGMPTRRSVRYASNGRRTGFITHTLKDNEKMLVKMLEDALFDTYEAELNEMIEQTVVR